MLQEKYLRRECIGLLSSEYLHFLYMKTYVITFLSHSP